MQRIELGDIAKDKITGFKGVVVCDSQWLHGCRRLSLQPQELKDGKPIPIESFDEPQLELVKRKVAASTAPTQSNPRAPGGPRPEPTRNVLRSILIVGALLTSTPLFAIDSLLTEAAKQEQERVKKATKGKATAQIQLRCGEVVDCVWLARVGEVYRYQRLHDGKLVQTDAKDVARMFGTVLDAVPEVEVRVLHMYCNGTSCKPTVKTIRVPAWPSPH